jgi:hypothetical protein
MRYQYALHQHKKKLWEEKSELQSTRFRVTILYISVLYKPESNTESADMQRVQKSTTSWDMYTYSESVPVFLLSVCCCELDYFYEKTSDMT